jgi:hypothetical protein
MAAVKQFGDHFWSEICKKVRRSVVFIDATAAECLHWNGGLARLRESGVEAVKELSSFESGESGEKKAVFIVDGPVVHLKVLKSKICSCIQNTLNELKIVSNSLLQQFLTIYVSSVTHKCPKTL